MPNANASSAMYFQCDLPNTHADALSNAISILEGIAERFPQCQEAIAHRVLMALWPHRSEGENPQIELPFDPQRAALELAAIPIPASGNLNNQKGLEHCSMVRTSRGAVYCDECLKLWDSNEPLDCARQHIEDKL